MERYRGWANQPTWSVAFHLQNSFATYEDLLSRAREMYRLADDEPTEIERTLCPDDPHRAARMVSARIQFADSLREEYEVALEEVGESVPGMFFDLLVGALGQVNWQEIAGSFLASALAVGQDAELPARLRAHRGQPFS